MIQCTGCIMLSKWLIDITFKSSLIYDIILKHERSKRHLFDRVCSVSAVPFLLLPFWNLVRSLSLPFWGTLGFVAHKYECIHMFWCCFKAIPQRQEAFRFLSLEMFTYVLSSICLVNCAGHLKSGLDRSWVRSVFLGKCGDGVLFLAFDLCLLSLSSLVERFCF